MVFDMRLRAVILPCLLVGRLTAQFGGPPLGQDPFPKGPSESNTKGSVKNSVLRVVSLRGTFRAQDNQEIFIETEDKRLLVVKLAKTTEFWKGGAKIKSLTFSAGDQLVIDATEDENRKYNAIAIVFDRSGTESEKAAASQPIEETAFHRAQNTGSKPANPNRKNEPETSGPPSTIQAVQAGEDPDRPKLARGRRAPPTHLEAEPAVPVTSRKPAAVVIPSSNEPDPFIDRAREEIGNYLATLPNYTVKQLTTRYTSTSAKTDWRALDHVSADLACENGKERYLNLSKKPVESGAWSTGEFATLLRDLFSLGTAAEFRFRGSSWMNKRDARLYDFKVPQERSHWHAVTPGQTHFPAYKGSVWIDKQTARPLRIEMQARDIPAQFPLDVIETAADYDFVTIGDSPFLLPVKADTLMCNRGTSECSLNKIEFRNYRKFGAKSEITF
jgi:hypothetical protein